MGLDGRSRSGVGRDGKGEICIDWSEPSIKVKAAVEVELQRAAEHEDDRYFNPKGSKNALSWLFEELLPGQAADVPDNAQYDKAAIKGVLRGAAREGKLKMLQSLQREGHKLWNSKKCCLAVEAAYDGGRLLELLKVFRLPMRKFSRMAGCLDKLEGEVGTLISHIPKARLSRTPTFSPNVSCEGDISHRTCFLANIVFMKAPDAVNTFQAAAEEMVVWKDQHVAVAGEGKAEVAWKEQHVVVRKREFFPEMHGVLFAKRVFDDSVLLELEYNEDERRLSFPGSKSGSTSRMANCTVSPQKARDLMIPLSACRYGFVYPCVDLPMGGFLYLDDDNKPVAINGLTADDCPVAFGFGPAAKFDPDSAYIEENFVDVPHDSPMREQGATRYAWLHATEMELWVQEDSLGGFAYVFDKDPSMNRVFSLISAGQTTRFGDLFWDVHACVLPRSPTSDAIEQLIRETNARPVTIMRIAAPGVLHPVMLHALAHTPCGETLETDVAKAITFAAFDRAWPSYRRKLLADLVGAASLTWVTTVAKGNSDAGNDTLWSWELENVAAYMLIAVVFVRNVSAEACLIMAFREHGWLADYADLATATNWTSMIMTCASLVLLICQPDEGVFWTVLGLAGWMRWFKIVTYLSGFLTLQLGMRILPVLEALWEGAPFIMVVFFFVAASSHFFYALGSQTTLAQMGLLTYNFGFLGDFDLDALVGEDPPSWSWVQYACFFLTSMLVMVSLTNIYIGVMANAYDFNQERSVQLFVRTRAAICLDEALLSEYKWVCCRRRRSRWRSQWNLNEECVWFCRDAPGQSDHSDGSPLVSHVTSLRGVVRESQKITADAVRDMRESHESAAGMVRDLQRSTADQFEVLRKMQQDLAGQVRALATRIEERPPPQGRRKSAKRAENQSAS